LPNGKNIHFEEIYFTLYFVIINSSTKNYLFSASNNRILNTNDYVVYRVGFDTVNNKLLWNVDEKLEAYHVTFHKTEPYTPVYTVHRINSNLGLEGNVPGLIPIQL